MNDTSQSDWEQSTFPHTAVVHPTVGFTTGAPNFVDPQTFVAQNTTQCGAMPQHYGTFDSFAVPSNVAPSELAGQASSMSNYSYPYPQNIAFPTYHANTSQTSLDEFASHPRALPFQQLQVSTDSTHFQQADPTPTSAGESASTHNYSERDVFERREQRPTKKRKIQQENTPPRSTPPVKRQRYGSVEPRARSQSLELTRQRIPQPKPLKPYCEDALDEMAKKATALSTVS